MTEEDSSHTEPIRFVHAASMRDVRPAMNVGDPRPSDKSERLAEYIRRYDAGLPVFKEVHKND